MSERDSRLYIRDMVRFAEKVLDYSKDMDRQLFEDDQLSYDAILRNLELVGEAATNVPESIRQNHPAVPWRQIIRQQIRSGLGHRFLETGCSPGTLNRSKRLWKKRGSWGPVAKSGQLEIRFY